MALHQLSFSLGFSIQVKDISFSYGIEDVFRLVIPKLLHGNDGLIYTCRETLYVPGTDPNMYVYEPRFVEPRSPEMFLMQIEVETSLGELDRLQTRSTFPAIKV